MGNRWWQIGWLPENRVTSNMAFVTGLVFTCQGQSKRDFLRKYVPKQCTAPRLEQHSWYFGHTMTQKLLPGRVKTLCLYKTGHRAEHRTEAGASFMLFIIIEWSKNYSQCSVLAADSRAHWISIWTFNNLIEKKFSGLHVEAKDGGINSSLWKPKINA